MDRTRMFDLPRCDHSTGRGDIGMQRAGIEALLRRWTKEAIGEGRLETFDELLAADVIDKSGAVVTRGVEPFKARTKAIRDAFSEIDLQVEDLIIDGDAIAWRWALTGTHAGSFAGIAPTGRRVTIRGVNFQRLQNGRVIEHWTMLDRFAAIEALRSPGPDPKNS